MSKNGLKMATMNNPNPALFTELYITVAVVVVWAMVTYEDWVDKL